VRLLITIIDWEYPLSKEEAQPMVWDLQNHNTLLGLILAYGNGVILELRADGENENVIDTLRSVVTGTGNSKKVNLSLEEKQSLWLYQEGDECYRQPMKDGGYTFINPTPQPHKFSATT
jgi:hypothetical protein